MVRINPGEEKEIILNIKTVVIDPEAFDGVDMEIVRLLEELIEGSSSDIVPDDLAKSDPATEIELCTEAVMKMDDSGKVEIIYRENEDDEQLSTLSKIIFNRSTPELVIMSKEGPINTFLSFEAGKTHICTYNTPFMPFKIYVDSKKVENRLLEDGELKLNYVLNLNDSDPQHFIINASIKDAPVDILKDFLENA